MPRRPIVAVTFLAVAAAGANADWPQWRGPGRDGAADAAPLTLPADGLPPVWKTADRLEGGWSSPVVADGRVYLYSYERVRREGVELPPPEYPRLSDEQEAAMPRAEAAEYERNRRAEALERQKRTLAIRDAVRCFDLSDGRELWTAGWDGRVVHWGQSSTPAVAGGRLYVVGSDNRLHAVDSKTGETLFDADLRWESEDGVPLSTSPLVADGAVVILAGRLMAVDAETGRTLWETDPDRFGGTYGSTVLHGDTVIANVDGGETVGVSLADGAERWRVKSGAGRSTPAVVGDRLLTTGSSRRDGLRCWRLGGSEPAEEWVYQRVADAGASPAAGGGLAMVAGDRKFAAVDLDTGREVWRTDVDADRPRFTSPIALGGQGLYACDGFWLVDSGGDVTSARFIDDGLLLPEGAVRERLNLDELERTAGGQAEAQRLWNDRVHKQGPLLCTTPAFADGRLVVRLKTGLACYELPAR